MKVPKSFVFDTLEGKARVEFSTYQDSKRIAILLVDAEGKYEGEPLATLTVNLPTQYLQEDEFFVKDWSENAPIAGAAIASGYFEDTGKRIPSGFVDVPIWRFSKKAFEVKA